MTDNSDIESGLLLEEELSRRGRDSVFSVEGIIAVQSLLGELGVSSSLWRPGSAAIGKSVPSADGPDDGRWCDELFEEAATKWRQLPTEDRHGPHEFNTQSGAAVMAVPIRHKRQTGYVLFCHLDDALKSEKTEELERLCSRLEIDVTVLLDCGLADAVSAGRARRVVCGILQVLLERANTERLRDAELEAMSDSLSQSYEELSLLHRISNEMKLTQQPESFFTSLCDDLKRVVCAEQLVVLCSTDEHGVSSVKLLASAGDMDLNENDTRLLWDRISQEVAGPGGVLIDSNVDGPYMHDWPGSIRNLVGVPVRRGQKNLGALVAINKTDKPDFDSIDTQMLLSVANASAVYLENFQLFRDLQDLLMGSLRALTSSIDAKDPYTCGHSERVAMISRFLAERMDLHPSQVNTIHLTGLLHDIGKIGVREQVLCKPGRLSADEFEQIKRHPQIGAKILSGIKQMAEVSEGVLTHHERFDGLGYPNGRRGKSIPLAGRIVMLADSFDAMMSDRTYRVKLPLYTALSEIRRYAGTQFDPDLADIFLHSDIATQLLDHINNGPDDAQPTVPADWLSPITSAP